MSSAVCTLFEGHYHHGVAALINSLSKNGFKGDIYCGYRGVLPKWVVKPKESYNSLWDGAVSMSCENEITVHFLPIETNFHLANYKPEFILRLFDGLAKQKSSIAYFDPDIVIKCNWRFFEKWMQYGVALVHEITANDMPASHPVRMEWKDIIEQNRMHVSREIHSYINSGFCGVSKEFIRFLQIWRDIIHFARTHYELVPESFSHESDRTYPFFAKDQDALNIAAMCSSTPISEVGPEGMDLIHGGFTMSHAIGTPKPWNKKFLLSALSGKVPSLADKAFWNNTPGPLKSMSLTKRQLKLASLTAASFIGRFYRRN